MLLKSIFLVLSFIFSVSSYSQYYKRSQIDSLKYVIKNQSGNEKVRTLLTLAEAYRYSRLDTAQLYANEAAKESEINDYEWGKYKSQYLAAKIKYENAHIDEVVPIVLNCHTWFKNNNYKTDEIKCDLFYSKLISLNKGKGAVNKLDVETLKKAEKSNDNALIGKAWSNIEYHKPHLLDNSKKAFPWSLDSAHKYLTLANDSIGLITTNFSFYLRNRASLEVFERLRLWAKYGLSINNNYIIAKTYTFMALNYTLLLEEDSTQFYFDKGMEFISERGSKRSMISLLKYKGYGYYRLEELDKALDNYQKAYDYAIELGDRKKE